MEWALNKILVDDLSSDSEMRSHMKAVSFKSIYNFILTSVDDQVVTIDVYRLHRSRLKLISSGNIVPSIWEGRRRFSQILFRLLVDALGEKMYFSVLEVVDDIDYYECESVE
jgi:hypothetical protein